MTTEAANSSGRQPLLLKNDPIVDAICELRFKPSQEEVAELMPGLLFASLKDKYPRLKSLPGAQLPRPVRKSDPNLANLPLFELVGDAARVSGTDHTVGVAASAPYPGWAVFKNLVLEAFDVVLKTGLVEEVERVSVKYVNLVRADQRTPLKDLIKADLRVGNSVVSTGPLTMRTEFKIDAHTVIFSLLADATARREGEIVGEGLVLDIDVISHAPALRTVGELATALDAAHKVEKDFFYSLITDSVLEACEPVYAAD